MLNRNINRIESNMATHYNFRRGKYGELNDELNQTNWEILEGMKVQAAWDYKKEKPYSATDYLYRKL